jgi:hypothetical protein
MKRIYLLSVFYLLSSCGGVFKKDLYIKDFKKDFKLQAYCSCVLYGYNDKNTISYMVKNDKSLYNPILNSVFSDEIRKIGLEEYEIIKLDSLKSFEKVSEGFTGKKVLYHCLNFYKSKKLDSLTTNYYKKWNNIKNKDSILTIGNSSY